VCYEVFVRSFYDSNGDGIGDLKGLTSRLDYINDGDSTTTNDLGATCIWLMPVAESPSYHGYDVSDYYKVEPDYGTNADFKQFMAAAHQRGIRVLVDMVLNHASSQHPSFQAALRDTASPFRSWYRFSPTDLGKGPWGAQAWHKSPVRDEYYYGVFWQGMPDLNYETAAVREEANKVASFWLDSMGVDGFRLDAVPYMVEDGPCLKDCPGVHTVLRDYVTHLRSVNAETYTVGEVWDSTGRVLPYYPDQLTSYFSFEIAEKLLRAVNTGSGAGVLEAYVRLQDTVPQHRYSPFLSNHDGNRVMTVLGGDAAKAHQAATLLLTLPGLPFVYYGEEIGMTGAKPDERIRTPMQWAPRAGLGFTTGRPWEASQPDSFTSTVERQNTDSTSLLNRYRRLIHLRGSNDALASGELVPLTASNPAVLAYLRRSGDHSVLVVANLAATPAEGVSLEGAPDALPSGRYAPSSLLGGEGGAGFEIATGGQLRGYAPSASLGPHQTLVLDLVRQ